MGFTLAEKKDFADRWKECYKTIMLGKSYSFNTGISQRSYTRQDADIVLTHMNYWQAEVDKATSGKKGIPTKFINPII